MGRGRIGKKLYTNVRLPLAEEIISMAQAEGRDVSEMIAVLLDEAVESRNKSGKMK